LFLVSKGKGVRACQVVTRSAGDSHGVRGSRVQVPPSRL